MVADVDDLPVQNPRQDRDDAGPQRQQQHEADHDDQVRHGDASDVAEAILGEALDHEEVESRPAG